MKRLSLYVLLGFVLWCSVQNSAKAQFFYIKNQTSTIKLGNVQSDYVFKTDMPNNAVINFDRGSLAFYFKVSTYSPENNQTDAMLLNEVVAANQFFHLEFVSNFVDKNVKLPSEGKSITFNTKGIWSMSNKQSSEILPITITNQAGKYFIKVEHTAKLRKDLIPEKHKNTLTGILKYELIGELKTELGY